MLQLQDLCGIRRQQNLGVQPKLVSALAKTASMQTQQTIMLSYAWDFVLSAKALLLMYCSQVKAV